MRSKSLPALPRTRDLGRGYSFRLLSAWELLEARREGETLPGDEEALRMNACLLARALLKGGRPAYPGGGAVLKALTAGQIHRLARLWGDFDRENDPKPWDEKAVDEAKKAWSTRLTSAFNGVCSALSALSPRRRGPGT